MVLRWRVLLFAGHVVFICTEQYRKGTLESAFGGNVRGTLESAFGGNVKGTPESAFGGNVRGTPESAIRGNVKGFTAAFR